MDPEEEYFDFEPTVYDREDASAGQDSRDYEYRNAPRGRYNDPGDGPVIYDFGDSVPTRDDWARNDIDPAMASYYSGEPNPNEAEWRLGQSMNRYSVDSRIAPPVDPVPEHYQRDDWRLEHNPVNYADYPAHRPSPMSPPVPKAGTFDEQNNWVPGGYTQADRVWQSDVYRDPDELQLNPNYKAYDRTMRDAVGQYGGAIDEQGIDPPSYGGFDSNPEAFGWNASSRIDPKTGRRGFVAVNPADILDGSLQTAADLGSDPRSDAALARAANMSARTAAHEVAHNAFPDHGPEHNAMIEDLMRSRPDVQDAIMQTLQAMRDEGRFERPISQIEQRRRRIRATEATSRGG